MIERRTAGQVVVTGAAGNLGTRVVAALVSRGHLVVASDRRAPAGELTARFVETDLRDHAAVTELVRDARDIVHLGNHPWLGPQPPQQVFGENVTMNANVFQAAAENGIERIVFASTVQLIGTHLDDRTVRTETRTPDYPIDGHTVPDPANLYALSKTVSESMLRYYADRCGLDITVLRFPLLHAHESRFRVARGEETLTGRLEAFSALSYNDAAGAIAAVLETRLDGYRSYAPAISHRHRDLAHAELVEQFYPGHDPTRPLVDFSELTHDTGWRPQDDYDQAVASRPTDPTEGSPS